MKGQGVTLLNCQGFISLLYNLRCAVILRNVATKNLLFLSRGYRQSGLLPQLHLKLLVNLESG